MRPARRNAVPGSEVVAHWCVCAALCCGLCAGACLAHAWRMLGACLAHAWWCVQVQRPGGACCPAAWRAPGGTGPWGAHKSPGPAAHPRWQVRACVCVGQPCNMCGTVHDPAWYDSKYLCLGSRLCCCRRVTSSVMVFTVPPHLPQQPAAMYNFATPVTDLCSSVLQVDRPGAAGGRQPGLG